MHNGIGVIGPIRPRDFGTPYRLLRSINQTDEMSRSEPASSTEKAKSLFSLGDKIEPDYEASPSSCMVMGLIAPADNRLAGFHRVNLFFSDDFPLASDRYELIELSAGSFDADTDGEYILDEWSNLMTLIWRTNEDEFYNVLCIKWKKLRDCTVAYRRALGRVEKTQWNSVATEFDVQLA
jgi:hypothetical protein